MKLIQQAARAKKSETWRSVLEFALEAAGAMLAGLQVDGVTERHFLDSARPIAGKCANDSLKLGTLPSRGSLEGCEGLLENFRGTWESATEHLVSGPSFRAVTGGQCLQNEVHTCLDWRLDSTVQCRQWPPLVAHFLFPSTCHLPCPSVLRSSFSISKFSYTTVTPCIVSTGFSQGGRHPVPRRRPRLCTRSRSEDQNVPKQKPCNRRGFPEIFSSSSAHSPETSACNLDPRASPFCGRI